VREGVLALAIMGKKTCFDGCLKYNPGLACHCEITIKTKESGIFAGEFDIGATTDLGKGHHQWCKEAITSDEWLTFATIVTLAPTNQDRWECFHRHSKPKDLVQELWSAATSGTAPRCLSTPSPDVGAACVLSENGKLMMGSKEAWAALFAEVKDRSYDHRMKVRIAGWVLTALAAGVGILSCGCFLNMTLCDKSGHRVGTVGNRVARVFSRNESQGSYEHPSSEDEEDDSPGCCATGYSYQKCSNHQNKEYRYNADEQEPHEDVSAMHQFRTTSGAGMAYALVPH